MALQKVINTPHAGCPNQWPMMQVIDLQGKRKPRFSLSGEQKVPPGLFATLSIVGGLVG
jgi:hypothetical protein